MTHDDLKKAYVCGVSVDEKKTRIRIGTIMDSSGELGLVGTPVAEKEMTRLVKTDDTKYFLMASIYELLTNYLPKGSLPATSEYGIEIR